MKLSKQTLDHLKTHVEYPISKADLLAACDGWSDVSEAERKAGEKLPNRTFNNANEVLKALAI